MADEIRDASELTSVQKAAVLVMNLPEDTVRDLLGGLDAEHVRSIGSAVATLPRLSTELVEDICLEFVGRLVSPSPLRLQGRRYLHNVFPRVADPGLAREIVRQIDGMELRSIRDWLATMPPSTMAAMLREQHPQTVAVVCALAEPSVAATIVDLLGEGLREEVILRMATLGSLPADVLADIEEILLSLTDQRPTESTLDMEGVEAAAATLKSFPPEMRETLLQAISSRDEELGEQLLRSMFSFDTMATADDRGVQALLRDIDRKDLTLALKGAPEAVHDKFLRNMSKRAADYLLEDLDMLGATRLEDVEEAQRRIMAQALALEAAGTLMFVDDAGGEQVA